MTNTKIVNAGTLAAAGANISNATKVSLAAGTREYTLEVKITNGASAPAEQTLQAMLRWAVSNTDGTAATEAANFGQNVQGHTIRMRMGPGEVTHVTTKNFVPTGSILYVWIEHGKLPANATVDVWVNEFEEAVAASGGDGSILTTGTAYDAEVSFTRPENTTAYSVGDVIGIADSGTPANAGSAIHELTGVGPAGGLMFFSNVLLQIGLSAVPANMTSFRLHVFNESPTAVLDNAAFDIASGDRAKYLGWLDIAPPNDFGATLAGEGTLVGKSFRLAAAQTSFWVILETLGGYTPASATSYSIKTVTERAA
jgi:hypothetical protein